MIACNTCLRTLSINNSLCFLSFCSVALRALSLSINLIRISSGLETTHASGNHNCGPPSHRLHLLLAPSSCPPVPSWDKSTSPRGMHRQGPPSPRAVQLLDRLFRTWIPHNKPLHSRIPTHCQMSW